MLNLHDVVKATRKITNEILKNCEGTIVFMGNSPSDGYIVEFFDKNDNTIDVIEVQDGDIEKFQNCRVEG
jgi:hypothetical protein